MAWTVVRYTARGIGRPGLVEGRPLEGILPGKDSRKPLVNALVTRYGIPATGSCFPCICVLPYVQIWKYPPTSTSCLRIEHHSLFTGWPHETSPGKLLARKCRGTADSPRGFGGPTMPIAQSFAERNGTRDDLIGATQPPTVFEIGSGIHQTPKRV